MYQTSQLCEPPTTEKNETFPYYEYYLGEKDDHNRRHGNGQNCWTGVESMEWHTGHFVRDTMHGPGEYRWRYRGKNGLFVTYEGNLYVNTLHGYGAVSYPDGRVFTGLFNNDLRYGPGIETFADLHANVGLWRGRLVRLAWRPAAPGVTPDLLAWPGGRPLVDPHRIVLNATCRSIGKVNQAVELLKQHGSDPVAATENWSQLYPKHCTDTASQLCHVDLFEGQYYNGKIYSLKEQGSVLENDEELGNEIEDGFEPFGTYYAWNNDKATMDMMKHCYKHERQREHARVDLTSVLSGPRNLFKPAAIHELDCRTLLMACYLGHVASTTYLVNERNVDPNVADMLGNSAVMYATCGDQEDLINFLVEAGANVDSVNDSCCTALGAALIRLACAKRDIPANGMMPALIPPPVVPASPPEPQTVSEWNINRDLHAPEPKNTLGRASKLNKMNMKEKSLISVKNQQLPNKKPPGTLDPIAEDGASVSLGYENNEDKLYKDINSEYISKVTDLFDTVGQPATYLFELKNMVEEINDEQLKMVQPEKIPKKKLSNKELRETTKPSKDTMWQNNQKDGDSQTSRESVKSKLCDRIKLTILQLLNSGANPRLVKCPQPALFVAIVAGCPDLVNHLVQFGADVNEVYSQLLYYTPLDIAVSQPMEHTTVDTVRALLSAGARADRRLRCVIHASSSLEPQLELPGPTLLHAVMARRCDSEAEEDVRRQIIELLLEYNCDPLKRYNGRSALDEATNNLELLDIIIKSPRTNLNGVINDAHQTILVKMFNMPYFKTLDNTERSQTLTKLLLFGADPLTECEHEGVKYKNLFVMAKNTLSDMTNRVKPVVESKTKINIPKNQKSVMQSKTKKEPKKEEAVSDDIANLKQAIDLMTECSRIIYIRWLQTKLAKELIQIIARYKHRHWSMIIKEHENGSAVGLWLTAQRCLEIWGHLTTTKKKIYMDKDILRNLLCISHFYHLRSVTSYGFKRVTSTERDETDAYVSCILKDSKKSEMLQLQRYVQPELFVNADSKFNVCFECFLPLTEEQIVCESCKFVSFCNMDCLKESIEKSNGHACNDFLVLKYFPSPPTTVDDDFESDTQHPMPKL